jgi:CheY-like chemotaxis protein
MSSTVLIVDDYADALEVLELTLGFAGYRTVRAATGLEAVRQASAHKPDAVVMDVFLPQLDGISAAVQIRALPGMQDVRIVGYTARSGRFDDAAVFDCVLRKPCPPDVLLATLAALLHRDCPAG